MSSWGSWLASLPILRKSKYWWWWIAMCLSIVAITIALFHGLDLWPSAWSGKETLDIRNCRWTDTDPQIFHMKTKTNVFYDAGQWYHMTENFLIQHSILKQRKRLSSSTNIFFNFDEDHFVDHFSGVTRLMVFLGTVTVKPNARYLHFMNSQALPLTDFNVDDGILVPRSLLKQGQVLDVADSVPVRDRYVKLVSGNEKAASIPPAPVQRPGEMCLRYMGAIGGSLRHKGKWFTEAGDISSLRHKMRRACPRDPKLVEQLGKKRKRKLVVYQRDKTRRLANQDEALRLLQRTLPEQDWDIVLFVHDNFISPCVLMHLLSDTDVLLTPHGFQSILLLFLPIPAILFEVFPSHYHRNVYRLVAEEYGLLYGYSMSAPTTWHTKLLLSAISTHTCGHYLLCRSYSRSQDVLLTKEGVATLWELIQRVSGRLDGLAGNGTAALGVASSAPAKRDFLYRS